MIPSNEVRNSSPNPPSLPSIREKLPELDGEVRRVIDLLRALPAEESYLPAWVPLYEKVHSLKGLTSLLPCPAELREDLVLFSDVLGEAHHGAFAPRETKGAIDALAEISTLLPAGGRLAFACELLQKSYRKEASHEERLLAIPRPIQQINAIVSKKAFEAVSLGLPMFLLEESMVLGDFTDWSKRLHKQLTKPNAPHGFVIHVAPHLISGPNSMMTATAWFTPGSKFAPGFVKILAELFPHASLKPCSA